MSAPNYHLEHSQTGSSSHERLGPAGKYYSVRVWEGGQLDLTGSNYGYGACSISGGNSINGNITLTGGGSIPVRHLRALGSGYGSDIANGGILDLSIAQVSGSTSAPNGGVYLYKVRG